MTNFTKKPPEVHHICHERDFAEHKAAAKPNNCEEILDFARRICYLLTLEFMLVFEMKIINQRVWRPST
jgi:hypothetical protein